MSQVVIVEDDKAIADMYKIKLEKQGFSVSVADNGKTGLELSEKVKPDLILLDIMMPEMRGDEMLAKMRQTDWGKKIKVIILTNISEDEVPVKLLDLDVKKYIVKANYTPRQVVELVENTLKS